MEHIAAISFEFRYGGEVSAKDIVGEYWKLFLEWVQRQVPSVNGWMVRAGFEVENDLVTVTLGDSTALELARKKNIDRAIVTFYETYFALQLRVKLQTGETSAEAFEEFQQRIVEEEREVIQKMMESMTVEARLKRWTAKSSNCKSDTTSRSRRCRFRTFRMKRRKSRSRERFSVWTARSCATEIRCLRSI
ncbi:hypothetical protein HMSSN036_36370 [Paenibacillus macerans]|nr:hypothetical protein HMSSN036_36370 [Paenibacillus macerans]